MKSKLLQYVPQFQNESLKKKKKKKKKKQKQERVTFNMVLSEEEVPTVILFRMLLHSKIYYHCICILKHSWIRRKKPSSNGHASSSDTFISFVSCSQHLLHNSPPLDPIMIDFNQIYTFSTYVNAKLMPTPRFPKWFSLWEIPISTLYSFLVSLNCVMYWGRLIVPDSITQSLTGYVQTVNILVM